MNKERIEQIARECGLSNNSVRRIHRFAQAIRNEALDEACKTVYGQCGNDNVAQRTVDAIRKMKV